MLATTEQNRAFLGALEFNNIPDLLIEVGDYQWSIHRNLAPEKLMALEQEPPWVLKNPRQPGYQLVLLDGEDPWIIARMIQFLYYGEHCLSGASPCPTTESNPLTASCCQNVTLSKMLEIGADCEQHEELATLDASRSAHEVYAMVYMVAHKYNIPDLCVYASTELQGLSYEVEDSFFKVMDIMGESVLYAEDALLESMITDLYDTYISDPAKVPRFQAMLKNDLRVATLVIEHVQERFKASNQRCDALKQKLDEVEQKYRDLERRKLEREARLRSEAASFELKINKLKEELSLTTGNVKPSGTIQGVFSSSSVSASEILATQPIVDNADQEGHGTFGSAELQSNTTSDTSTETQYGSVPQGKSPRAFRPQAGWSFESPKRSLSAYMFFANENRDRVRSENPDISFGQLGKLLGEEFKALADEAREKYYRLADDDKKRYENEKNKYDAAQKSQTSHGTNTTANPSLAPAMASTDQTQFSSAGIPRPALSPSEATGTQSRSKTRVRFPPTDTEESSKANGAAEASTRSTADSKPEAKTRTEPIELGCEQVQSPPPVKSPANVPSAIKTESENQANLEQNPSPAPSPFASSKPQQQDKPQIQPLFGKPATLQAPTIFGSPGLAANSDRAPLQNVAAESIFAKYASSSALPFDQSIPKQKSLFGESGLFGQPSWAVPSAASQTKQSTFFGGPAQSSAFPFSTSTDNKQPNHPSLFGASSQTGSFFTPSATGGTQPKPPSLFGQTGFGLFGSPSPPSTGAQANTTSGFGSMFNGSKPVSSEMPASGFNFVDPPVSANIKSEKPAFGTSSTPVGTTASGNG